MQTQEINSSWADVGRLRLIHDAAFIVVFSVYGTQVCPYIDGLEIWWIIGPTAAALAAHQALAALARKWVADLPLASAARRLFWVDFGLFALSGFVLGAVYMFAYGFPFDSGAKVLIGFLALGFYVSLDLTFEREIKLAKQLQNAGGSLPLSARFWPFQTKFVIFSTINLVIIGLVVTMVVIKDLIWAANTDLDPIKAQLLIVVELIFILVVLCAYVFRSILQYGRKTDLMLAEEREALVGVKRGDLSRRVSVVSSDEFGEIGLLTNQMIARLATALDDVRQTRDATIKALVSLSAKRDNETGLHLLRTQIYVEKLARELEKTSKRSAEIDAAFIGELVASAPLHDIGKVGVPDAILTKPGKLTDDEFSIMKTHAAIGADAIASADQAVEGSSFLEMAQDIARSHHERWDGRGYPDGLSGEAIPLAARIMAVADVYDALRSKRVYKPPMSHRDATRIIVEGRGTQFDPEVVDAFSRIEACFEAVAEKHGDNPTNASDNVARAPATADA